MLPSLGLVEVFMSHLFHLFLFTLSLDCYRKELAAHELLNDKKRRCETVMGTILCVTVTHNIGITTSTFVSSNATT